MGGSNVRFPKVGRVRTRATRAVAAPMIAQVSVPYVNTLWTQALYIFLFMWYDAPLAVRIGDNSLNLAQANLTLALAASSTPPPAPSVSPK